MCGWKLWIDQRRNAWDIDLWDLGFICEIPGTANGYEPRPQGPRDFHAWMIMMPEKRPSSKVLNKVKSRVITQALPIPKSSSLTMLVGWYGLIWVDMGWYGLIWLDMGWIPQPSLKATGKSWRKITRWWDWFVHPQLRMMVVSMGLHVSTSQ